MFRLGPAALWRMRSRSGRSSPSIALPISQVGALVMTIDPLSMFFWMAALYTFWLALERSPGFSRWWPATGALIGLGFLAKYTNAIAAPLDPAAPRFHAEIPARIPARRASGRMLGVFALFAAPVHHLELRSTPGSHSFTSRPRGGLETGASVSPR